MTFRSRLEQVFPGFDRLHFWSSWPEAGKTSRFSALVSRLMVSPSFFSKSVAPDGALRIRICTIGRAANRKEASSSCSEEPCEILPINMGHGDSGISLYDSRVMKNLPINVGQGDLIQQATRLHCSDRSTSWRTSNPGSCRRKEEGLGLGAHQ